MALTIDEAISRVPFLAGRSDLAISCLTGGITNLNYKVSSGEGTFVIRITGSDTELLGINREAEHVANLEAGKLGIAPEVLFFIQPEGYLVTRYVLGVPVPPPEMRKIDNLRRVAEKLHLFHRNGPPLPVQFNPFRRIERLTAVARDHQCRFPGNFAWIMERVHEAESALLKDPYIPNPCHDDLLNLNFLDEQGELRILDWEYAGMGDIFFDLANFSHHHDLDDHQIEMLLEFYFGGVSAPREARLRLMWPISEVHEAMWGTAQSGISKLDEDFQGYASHWFTLATRAMQDSRWQGWLNAIGDHSHS